MTNSPTERCYDFVIVGGGSAGAVLANRLSADPARTVLLIEAGPDYPDGDYPPDLLAGQMASVEPYRTWGYAAAPDTNGHAIQAWAGKVIGGGSTINGAVSRRARPSDFARWESHGLPEWSWDQVVDTYKAIENTPTGDDRWHGRSGPWPIRQDRLADLTPAVRAYVEAAVAGGYTAVTDFNDPTHRGGAGAEAINVVDGVRHNTAMAYLTGEVRARANLTILPDTLIDRVAFAGQQATAVVLADGRTIAAAEVILSAGTFGSAAILLRSGIGPVAHLGSMGIDVIADLPVGMHLQDQPMVVTAFPLKPQSADVALTGSGILWISSTDADCIELDQQLSISVQPGYDLDGTPSHVLSSWACLVGPRSTGRLRLKSRDARTTPYIDFKLLTAETDRTRLRDLLRIALRLYRDRAVVGFLAVAPDQAAGSSDADLDGMIDKGLTTFIHATSSAPMGGNDSRSAVVDAWGTVHGTENLRVVDASIFPTAISVPTNLTVLMIAERIAARIKAI